ncbi:zinc-ribbon domain-containing protein [Yeosuana sp.]|uniref:zinc-ribbon domain-containing protein n=1 Tax=Yeosuana sp. TaxID=2529388 RepID=UPI004054CD0B|tara:strand:- start:3695 stop:3964 length:270 start_codon:yes stop_codon:yes gene_type:complete
MGFLKHLLRGMGRGGHHSGKHGQKHDYGYQDDYSGTKVLIRCPKCGNDNDQNALFCQKCGSSLGKVKCNDCNGNIPTGAKFCPKCGIKV